MNEQFIQQEQHKYMHSVVRCCTTEGHCSHSAYTAQHQLFYITYHMNCLLTSVIVYRELFRRQDSVSLIIYLFCYSVRGAEITQTYYNYNVSE